jgi:hypothetical protein
VKAGVPLQRVLGPNAENLIVPEGALPPERVARPRIGAPTVTVGPAAAVRPGVALAVVVDDPPGVALAVVVDDPPDVPDEPRLAEAG